MPLLASHRTYIDFNNKTQGIFVQDFPAIADGKPDDRSEFGQDLRDYFQQLSKSPLA